MRRRRIAIAWLLFMAAGSCGRKAGQPTAPESHLPPDVIAVYPTARSTQIFYETDIWAQFGEPLDSTTVSETTVFLKLDTRRVPVTVTYESATRRIRLALRARLELRRTYTVELTPALATADGRRFGETWFWQFATNGLRRPGAPLPASGVTGESPFALLEWTGTEATAGDIAYQLYSGADSSEVASHLVAPRQVLKNAYFLPDSTWGVGRTVYWSITSLNRSTGERLDGPVWRFDTVPAGTPIDSVTYTPTRWAYVRQGSSRVSCSNGNFTSAPDFTCVLRFPLELLPADTRLAGVELILTPTSFTNTAARSPSLWPTLTDISTCNIAYPGPPFTDEQAGPVVRGAIVNQNGRDRFRFASDLFTAHAEAMVRRRGLFGYMLRSNVNTSWIAPYGSEFDFRFKVYYFHR